MDAIPPMVKDAVEVPFEGVSCNATSGSQQGAVRATPDISVTEAAVLSVLLASVGKVRGRDSILRMAGIDHCGSRRCDAAIVRLRRVLGADSILTVRRRGWMLTPKGIDRARQVCGAGFFSTLSG